MKPKSERLEKLRDGFLSPTGEFFPCSYMGHIQIADKILEPAYYTDPEEQLRKMGWVDIHREVPSGKYNICWNYYGHLSPEQVRLLKPLVEDSPENVVFDKLWLLNKEFER